MGGEQERTAGRRVPGSGVGEEEEASEQEGMEEYEHDVEEGEEGSERGGLIGEEDDYFGSDRNGGVESEPDSDEKQLLQELGEDLGDDFDDGD